MTTKSMADLRIYDWKETIKRGTVQAKNLPTSFSFVQQDSNLQVKAHGTWGNWELTDEGYNQYPVFKCFITDGTLEIRQENTDSSFDLNNSWIKICAKLECNEQGRFSCGKQKDGLYALNYAFPFCKAKNKLIGNLLSDALVAWFKENQNLLEEYINLYSIEVQTSKDLTLAGWDTNYVTSFTNVNHTIQKKQLFPEGFTHEFVDDGIIPIHLKLDTLFRNWEITTGADGQNVNFRCHMDESSTLTVNEAKVHHFASDALLKIQVKLAYFNSVEKTVEDPTGMNDGVQTELKINPKPDAQDNPPVILVDAHYSDDLDNGVVNSLLNTMFKDWLNQNTAAFENIFSYFLLHETSQEEDFQWLKPTTAYYGVSSVENANQQPDLDKSVFSVMSMVENHQNEFPQHTVDARLLEAVNNESAFGIDTPLFVQKWLLKALIVMQVGTLDQFEFTNNGMMITNKEKIKFATIEGEDEAWEGAEAFIEAGNFKLGIVNNQVALELIDIMWTQSGIVAHVDYIQNFDLVLQSGTDSEGKSYENVLIPKENTEPVYRVTFTKETWKFWTDLCVDIAAGIALGIGFGIVGKIGGKALDKIFKGTKKIAEESGGRMVISSGAKGLGKAYSEFIKEIFQSEGGKKYILPLLRSATNDVSKAPVTKTGRITVTKAFMDTILKAKKPFIHHIWERKFKLIGGLFFGAVGGAIPTGVISAINHLQEERFGSLPTIEQFVLNCVGTVKWPEHSEFKVETAQMQGIYLMGGKINKL